MMILVPENYYRWLKIEYFFFSLEKKEEKNNNIPKPKQVKFPAGAAG